MVRCDQDNLDNINFYLNLPYLRQLRSMPGQNPEHRQYLPA